MMRGKSVPAAPVLVPPRRVIVRQSTNVLMIEDNDLSQALRVIHENATNDLRVGELVRQVAISRRVLEQKFLKLLGRSPAEEIRRVRIEKVKQLLEETDWSVARVALACHFMEPEGLTRIFTRTVGMPPSQYRQKFRQLDDNPHGAVEEVR
jgi:LacI family transcriptional regulator